MQNGQFCWFHNPLVTYRRHASNSLGGKALAPGIYAPLPPVKLEDYHEISDFMLEILNRLRAGEINSHTAFAMAHIFKLLREWHNIDKDYKQRQENWRKRLAEIQSEQQEEHDEEEQDEGEDEDQDEDQNEDDKQDEDQDEDVDGDEDENEDQDE